MPSSPALAPFLPPTTCPSHTPCLFSPSAQASLPDLLTNTRPISGFSAVQPHPRIILINPNLDLSSLRTPRHYQLLAFGLAQLAALSNRSLVWPAVDCASPLFPRVPLTAFSLFDSYYHPPAVNASFGYPHTSINPQREQQQDTNGQAATINPNGQRTGESLAESWAASVLLDAAADAGQRRAAAQQLRVPSLALPFFSTLVDRMQCMPLAALCLGCLQALSRYGVGWRGGGAEEEERKGTARSACH